MASYNSAGIQITIVVFGKGFVFLYGVGCDPDPLQYPVRYRAAARRSSRLRLFPKYTSKEGPVKMERKVTCLVFCCRESYRCTSTWL